MKSLALGILYVLVLSAICALSIQMETIITRLNAKLEEQDAAKEATKESQTNA